MQYICNTYLSETFHVKHFVNTDTELQPIMVKKKEKSPRPLRSWWWFNHWNAKRLLYPIHHSNNGKKRGMN